MKPMLIVQDLSKNYKTSTHQNYIALDQVSLDFPSKGFIFIVGQSGSGKTTLINLIGLLDRPTSGEVIFYGNPSSELSTKDMDYYRSQYIGFVFQEGHFINNYNVSENIKLALDVQKNSEIFRINDALKDVSIHDLSNRKPYELSSGERQRATIARAIAKDSKILLCDEPTGNLDQQNAEIVLKILKKLSFTRLVIMVTHQESFIETYCDRLIRLDQGKVIEDILIRDHKLEENIVTSTPTKTTLPIKNIFSIILSHLKHQWLHYILMVIIITSSIVTMSSLYAISKYSNHNALVETLKYNENYVIPVIEYFEKANFNGGEIFMYGAFNNNNLITNQVVEEFKESINFSLPVYKSYYFMKNIQDFMDYKIVLTPETKSNVYLSTHFTDVIIVDDYSSFNEPLLLGSLPIESNDILIYDYMAYMMYRTETIPSIDSIEDFIDFELVDLDTGLSMKIKGIIKSNHVQYQYSSNGNSFEYWFEALYLARLQSIYAKPELLPLIQSEESLFPINNVTFVSNNDYTVRINSSYRKLRYVQNIENYDFIGNISSEDFGLLLSKHQFADLLDIDVSEVNADLVNSFDYSPNIHLFYTPSETTKSLRSSFTIDLFGVYESDELSSYIADCIYCDQIGVYPTVGNLRMMYLSLSNDWNQNSEILSNLHLYSENIEFYYENPDYIRFGYAESSPYQAVVNNAEVYIESVQSLGYKILVITALAFILALSSFSTSIIKRNRHDIGVYKSLGVTNFRVALVMCFDVFICIVLGFVASIGLTQFLLSFINYDFYSILVVPVIFFTLRFIDYLLIFGLLLLLTIISISVPLYRVMKMMPIDIMKDSK